MRCGRAPRCAFAVSHIPFTVLHLLMFFWCTQHAVGRYGLKRGALPVNCSGAHASDFEHGSPLHWKVGTQPLQATKAASREDT